MILYVIFKLIWYMIFILTYVHTPIVFITFPFAYFDKRKVNWKSQAYHSHWELQWLHKKYLAINNDYIIQKYLQVSIIYVI